MFDVSNTLILKKFVLYQYLQLNIFNFGKSHLNNVEYIFCTLEGFCMSLHILIKLGVVNKLTTILSNLTYLRYFFSDASGKKCIFLPLKLLNKIVNLKNSVRAIVFVQASSLPRVL